MWLGWKIIIQHSTLWMTAEYFLGRYDYMNSIEKICLHQQNGYCIGKKSFSHSFFPHRNRNPLARYCLNRLTLSPHPLNGQICPLTHFFDFHNQDTINDTLIILRWKVDAIYFLTMYSMFIKVKIFILKIYKKWWLCLPLKSDSRPVKCHST